MWYVTSQDDVLVSQHTDNPELVTDFISDNPEIVSEYVSTHPDVVKDLALRYASEHWQEMLSLAFSFILSQPMLLAGLIGVLLILPLIGFTIGWLVARGKYRKKQ